MQAFKINAERIRTNNSVTLRISIIESINTNLRIYNRPTAREIAALILLSGRANKGTR